MRLLISVIVSLLVSTIAAPLPGGQDEETYQKMVRATKALKDPQTYEPLKNLSLALKAKTSARKSVDLSKLEAKDKNKFVLELKSLDAVAEGTDVLYELSKATLAARATEEQLTSLAKRLSKVAREQRLSVRNHLADSNSLMTDETIGLLKQIVTQNPFKESRTSHLEALKEKNPKLYTVLSRIKNVDRNVRAGIKTGNWSAIPNETEAGKEMTQEFMLGFFLDELFALLKSEQAAIEIFKDFGIITSALQTASSYESLQALYNALAKSKRLEAYAILVREIGKCAGQELTTEEQAQSHLKIANFLQALKVLLADEEDPSNFPALAQNYDENDDPMLPRLYAKIVMSVGTQKGWERFRQCFISEGDHKVFKEALTLTDPVLTNAQLSAIRQNNEKIYALIHVLNGMVKVVREGQELGTEANSFLKEMVTMPNTLLHIAQFFPPSEEIFNKRTTRKKAMIDKFNSLSDQAKEEFIDVFPYRSAINIALLD